MSVQQPTYIAQPSAPGVAKALAEVWRSRRLLALFIWRDIHVRYKHTFLGAAWNIIQPLGMMLVYTLVFGLLLTGRMGEVEYPLFLFPAILLWQVFAKGINTGGTSLENFLGVLNKVYFPRMIAPASAVLVTVFDLLVCSVALAAMMLYYGSWPTWHIVFAPLFIGLTLVIAFGLALWLTTLDANYKDVRHTLHFVTQFWLFASPVMYPISLVPERYQIYYFLNPMVDVVQGFRWSLVPGTSAPTFEMLAPSIFFALFFLTTGIRYFAAREGTLVDTV